MIPLRVLQRPEVRAAVAELARSIVDATLADEEAAATPIELGDIPLTDKKATRRLAEEYPGISTAELKALDEPIQRAVWDALEALELAGAGEDRADDRSDRAEDDPELQRQVRLPGHGGDSTVVADGRPHTTEVKR